jgi:hypothetical protein
MLMPPEEPTDVAMMRKTMKIIIKGIMELI